jgi:hypothetical protein
MTSTALVTFCACDLESSKKLARLKALVKSWEGQLAPMCPLYLAVSGADPSAEEFLSELDETLGVYVLRCGPCTQFAKYKLLLESYDLSTAWINFVDADDELLPARNVIQLDLFAQADQAKLEKLTLVQHQRFMDGAREVVVESRDVFPGLFMYSVPARVLRKFVDLAPTRVLTHQFCSVYFVYFAYRMGEHRASLTSPNAVYKRRAQPKKKIAHEPWWLLPRDLARKLSRQDLALAYRVELGYFGYLLLKSPAAYDNVFRGKDELKIFARWREHYEELEQFAKAILDDLN